MFKCGGLAAHWYTQILKDHQNFPLGLIHLLRVLTVHHSRLFTKMPKSTKGVNLWKTCIFTLLPCQQPNIYKQLKNIARVVSVTGPIFNKLMVTSISSIPRFSSVLYLPSPGSVTPSFYLDHNLGLQLPQLSSLLCWCSAKFLLSSWSANIFVNQQWESNINFFVSSVWIKLSSDFETAILKTGFPSKYLLSQMMCLWEATDFFSTLFCILNKTHPSYTTNNLLSSRKFKYNQQYVIFCLI